jgi:uncharacterized protein YjbJ (UPF0337 family)
MNWDQIAGNWKQFQGHVKEKWGKLTDTDDDLDVIEGKKDQLVGRSGMATPKSRQKKNSRAGNKITESFSGSSCP